MGPLVEQRLEVAVLAERTEDSGPDVNLFTRSAVRSVHQLEVVVLL